MLSYFLSLFKFKKHYQDIAPDEIFLDSQNLPDFDIHQFEGRIEKPISKRALSLLALVFVSVGGVFLYKLWDLQIIDAAGYSQKSENNRLADSIVFANRGVIFDRNEVPLVWNDLNQINSDFARRMYATSTGLSTVLGYVKYPTKDSSGFYYQTTYVPKDGIEKMYNEQLSGVNGYKLTETDALGKATSLKVVEPPVDGGNLHLSIDAGIQKTMYKAMLEYAAKAGYRGGGGVIMDVESGEIIAMASFPEYDSNTLSLGTDSTKITDYLTDKNNPFLNRVVSGLYTPGSIVKPFIAMGALTEGIINPNKQIRSTGSLTIPNPYNHDQPTVFRDWKAHGLVDMRRAIAVSSNVYFFEIGGGFEDQKGLGISRIEKYMRMFGFGEKTGIESYTEKAGVIPNPTWKKTLFGADEEWRLGDTYNTSIGQYGVQVTPLQAVRAIGAIANGGKLLYPTVIKPNDAYQSLSTPVPLSEENFQIVREGMRMTVTEGTAQSLSFPFVKVAAKTGTAELGPTKSLVNSWTVGYFPADKPRYAFAVVMEKGRSNNQVGATLIMRDVLNWMNLYAPEYFQ
ncbi:MAG: hypothetical protein RL292_188 [Candidatus Parcubacteria bacterium]|jgi:penicillin-binding protein 2